MSILRAFICLAALAVILDIAEATNFTVGGPAGSWDTTTNLQTWASSQSFLVGDNLGIYIQYTNLTFKILMHCEMLTVFSSLKTQYNEIVFNVNSFYANDMFLHVRLVSEMMKMKYAISSIL